MQELRLVAVSEDGGYAVLVAPGRSGRFALPIDERLRTVARGQFSRLAQYDIEVESPLRPKEIQDRIRAGETAEEIADSAGLPVDRIRRFEGPVLAEREYRAQEARRATVRGLADAGPGPRLGDVVEQRLADLGSSTDDAEWDSRKRPDGNWQVQLAYLIAGRMQVAEWVYDPRSKHVTPDDDHAIELCLPESQWPPAAARPGGARGQATATVTPIGSRAAVGPPRYASESRRHPSEPVRPAAEAPAAAADPPRPAAEPLRPAAGLTHPVAESRAARADREATALEVPDRDLPVREIVADLDQPAEADLAPGAYQPEVADLPARPAGAADNHDEPAAAAGEPDRSARPARRTSGGRPRRASVPSWDEIMFGNSRQPE